MIFTVPLLLKYLGEERYGMFSLVSSVQGIIAFSDLGLGLGLQNKIPYYLAKKDMISIKRSISTTFFLLVSISFCLLFIAIFCINFFNLNTIYNVSSDLAKSEIYQISFNFLLIFFLGLPFTIIFSVFNGLQKSYITETWKAFGYIFCLVGIYLGVKMQSSASELILIFYGSSSIVAFLAFIFSFYYYDIDWKPNIKYIEYTRLKSIFNISSKYFLLQILAVFLMTIDGFLIARYEGASATTDYFIALRLIIITSVPLTIINGQILPSVNDAKALNDNEWIKENLRKLLFFNIGYIFILSTLFLFFTNNILKIWIGNGYEFDFNRIISMVLLFAFLSLNSLFSNILLMPKFLSYTIKLFPICILILSIVKIFVINFYDSVIMISIGAVLMLLIYILPSYILLKKENIIK